MWECFMKKGLLIALVLVIVFPIIAHANDGPSEVNLLTESFEDQFPPQGWQLAQSNSNQTWKRVTDAFDGKLKSYDSYFAYVQSDASTSALSPSDEMLITYPLNIPYECSGINGNYSIELKFYYYAEFTADFSAVAIDNIVCNCLPDDAANNKNTVGRTKTITNEFIIGTETNYKFSIELSKKQFPDWDAFDIHNISISSTNFHWEAFAKLYPYTSNPFWIGFRFKSGATDDDEQTDDDDLPDNDTSEDDTNNDDLDNDDLDNDDISDDDNNEQETSDNGSDNSGCGCSTTTGHSDLSLFAAMLLIGVGAWIVAKRVE